MHYYLVAAAQKSRTIIVCRSLHPAILTGERGRFCVIAAAYGIVLCADGADGGHSGAGVLGRHRYHLRGQRRAADHPNHRITRARGNFLDRTDRPLTGTDTTRYALCVPGDNSYSALLPYVSYQAQTLLYERRNSTSPFLVEIGQIGAPANVLLLEPAPPYAAQPYCCAPAGLPRPGRPRRHRAGTRLGRCAGKLLRPDRSRLPDHRPRTAAGHRARRKSSPSSRAQAPRCS